MPLSFESPLLHCYWIALKWPTHEGEGIVIGLDQAIGIGVTAYSIEDAIHLMDEMGYSRYLNEAEKVDWIEVTELTQMEKQRHLRWTILPNSGPLYFRGVWMGAYNLGFGASGQRRMEPLK